MANSIPTETVKAAERELVFTLLKDRIDKWPGAISGNGHRPACGAGASMEQILKRKYSLVYVSTVSQTTGLDFGLLEYDPTLADKPKSVYMRLGAVMPDSRDVPWLVDKSQLAWRSFSQAASMVVVGRYHLPCMAARAVAIAGSSRESLAWAAARDASWLHSQLASGNGLLVWSNPIDEGAYAVGQNGYMRGVVSVEEAELEAAARGCGCAVGSQEDFEKFASASVGE